MSTRILKRLASQTCTETGDAANYVQSIFKYALSKYQLRLLVERESYHAIIKVRHDGAKTSRQKVAGLRRSLGL